MSKVNRSTYQKLAEENKRLKKDIEIMVMRDDAEKTKEVFRMYYKMFRQEREMSKVMKEAAIEYIRRNKDSLPKFLTDKLTEQC